MAIVYAMIMIARMVNDAECSAGCELGSVVMYVGESRKMVQGSSSVTIPTMSCTELLGRRRRVGQNVGRENPGDLVVAEILEAGGLAGDHRNLEHFGEPIRLDVPSVVILSDQSDLAQIGRSEKRAFAILAANDRGHLPLAGFRLDGRVEYA